MSNYQDEIKQATELKKQAGSSWHDITPEYVARMRLQNRFKTGLDIAKIRCRHHAQRHGRIRCRFC